MSKKPIQLKFECNQDWNAMKATSCGRFCNVCNKEVIDFTTKSRSEFNSLITHTADICGRFKPEQLDPSLIRPISPTFHRRAFLFISTVMITIISKPLYAQSDTKKTETVINPVKPAVSQPSEEILTPETPSSADHQPFIRTKKRRYYWSKRFPFIVVYRNHRITTMGCPSF